MAKVALSKLGLKVNNEIKEVEFNGQKIEVKQYLPFNEKVVLVADIINHCQDDNNFKNTLKIECAMVIECINYFTNITVTDKQSEDLGKLYDLYVSSGLWSKVLEAIGEEEYNSILYHVNTIFDNIFVYRNSIYGILDAVKTDYSDLDLDALKITKELQDGGSINFVKDVLTKLN